MLQDFSMIIGGQERSAPISIEYDWFSLLLYARPCGIN